MKLRAGSLKRKIIDKTLARLTKNKRLASNRIRKERWEVTTDITKLQRIITDYNEKLPKNWTT